MMLPQEIFGSARKRKLGTQEVGVIRIETPQNSICRKKYKGARVKRMLGIVTKPAARSVLLQKV